MATMVTPLATTLLQRRSQRDQQWHAHNQAKLQAQENKRQYDLKMKREAEQKKRDRATAVARMAGQGRGIQDGSAAALLNGLSRSHNEEAANITNHYAYQSRPTLLKQDRKISRLEQLFGSKNGFNRFF
ncbi:MAG: hypothetical protein AB8B77_03605 [Alphaproteobacteria bacterium]